MKKLKIAVWHNLPSGGGKRQLYYHVKGLLERGHKVESWCPDTADQKFLPLSELVKENIVPLRKKRALAPRTLRARFFTRQMLAAIEENSRVCAAAIEREGFDLLYANACRFLRTTPIARYLTIPSALYLGEPYRWFYEAMPELPWIDSVDALENKLSPRQWGRRIKQNILFSGARLQARAELEYAKAFDNILVNSSYSRESVLRAYNLESEVCYLGIDTNLYKPTGEPKENFLVGLGTFYSAKGVDRAIRAVAAIKHEKRPALVWIGNGGRELASYVALANELNVHFIPKLDISDAEVVSLLNRARAMIYTSRLEPFGLAPLEANACGTPVVAIAEGGVRETIVEDVNGFLARSDDSDELANLLLKFLENPALAQNIGRTARAHVEAHWSLQRCTDNIENQLLALAKRQRKNK